MRQWKIVAKLARIPKSSDDERYRTTEKTLTFYQNCENEKDAIRAVIDCLEVTEYGDGFTIDGLAVAEMHQAVVLERVVQL